MMALKSYARFLFGFVGVAGVFAFIPQYVKAGIVTFEDVGAGLSSGSYNDGGPVPNQNGFQSGGVSFQNSFQIDANFGYSYWYGWAYSNVQNTTNPNFTNQYASYAGGGAGGSATYGIAYFDSFSDLAGPKLTFNTPVVIQNVDLSNTTYAALSMRNGDSFTDKFGAIYDNNFPRNLLSVNDPDFLKVTFYGLDALGGVTATKDIYLADYRFSDNSQDFILGGWNSFDLSGLGAVNGLRLVIESSDFGTPTYLALDNLNFTDATITAVPEPSSIVMFSIVAAGGAVYRKVKRSRKEGKGASNC